MLFQDLTINDTFSFRGIRNVSIVGCPQIKIELASEIEEVVISDTSRVTVLDGASMTKLKFFHVHGRSQSEKTILKIEPNPQNWATKITSLSLLNVMLINLPVGILLKSLNLFESLVKEFVFENSTPGIEEIKVLNSAIENVTSLRSLSSINQMTFENNIILSSCSACEKDEATCFIDPVDKYTNNSLPCQCQDQCGCNKGKIYFLMEGFILKRSKSQNFPLTFFPYFFLKLDHNHRPGT